MKVYTIKTKYYSSEKHCVVAESMAEAERIFNGKYWPTSIKSIGLYSDYVQIQGYDEQNKAKQEGVDSE